MEEAQQVRDRSGSGAGQARRGSLRAGENQGTHRRIPGGAGAHEKAEGADPVPRRSEEHTSELQSLMRISYAVFCLQKKPEKHKITNIHNNITVNETNMIS